MRFLQHTLTALLALAAFPMPIHAEDSLSNFPENASPERVGKAIAESFLTHPFRYETNPAKRKLGVIYPEVITAYGALHFARVTKDDALAKSVIARFQPIVDEEGTPFINRAKHVDYHVFGAFPLEVFLFNHDKSWLKLGLSFADDQWLETTPDGITKEARYWIDDMYMIPLLQVQAYRATKNPAYRDHVAHAMAAYLKKLQRLDGLFHHGTDSPYYWGRGNGWIACGMADVLSILDDDHPQRAEILAAYRKMMAALLKTQSPDGAWRQLIDDEASWPESSGTAMFTYAIVQGVKHGWLPADTYGPAARKAWLHLAAKVDAKGQIADVCIGTDKGHSTEFYNERPKVSGDLHGQAPMLWTAAALLEVE